MEALGYLLSVLMGLSLGLLGAGGAILTVPILVYFFYMDPKVATVDSLFIVGMTAFFGAAKAKIQNRISLKIALLYALPGLMGVSFAKYVFLPLLPEQIFSLGSYVLLKSTLIMLVFATLIFFSAFAMVRGQSANKLSSELIGNFNLKLIAQGFFVGFITGFIGAGGGFLIIPALVGIVGLPMHIAVGTSLAIITINSLFGFLVGLHKGFLPQWNLLISILLISLVGFFIGSRFAQKISEKNLKKIFGVLLIIVAIFILYDQIF